MFFTGTAQDVLRSTSNDQILEPTDLVGIWSYRVADIDNGYEEGLLIVDKMEGLYAVQVQLQNRGSLNAYDVLVEGDVMQFHVNLDGVERVGVVLGIKGKELEGQVITGEGSRFSVKGAKQLPEN
ncbi:hypothetical protein DZC72_00860 [Maribacter algicola]|uniref:Uncharacterized protein n=1 Tax=Maribacter algicola TaxID=2498892 RepID=A0A426RJS0_9FLAO|nr:hypothetical protein DZC72_00860 [Maribacter algicola]